MTINNFSFWLDYENYGERLNNETDKFVEADPSYGTSDSDISRKDMKGYLDLLKSVPKDSGNSR